MERKAHHSAIISALGHVSEIEKQRLVSRGGIIDERVNSPLLRADAEPIAPGLGDDEGRVIEREMGKRIHRGPTGRAGLGRRQLAVQIRRHHRALRQTIALGKQSTSGTKPQEHRRHRGKNGPWAGHPGPMLG